jgi:hypothetical protein
MWKDDGPVCVTEGAQVLPDVAHRGRFLVGRASVGGPLQVEGFVVCIV